MLSTFWASTRNHSTRHRNWYLHISSLQLRSDNSTLPCGLRQGFYRRPVSELTGKELVSLRDLCKWWMLGCGGCRHSYSAVVFSSICSIFPNMWPPFSPCCQVPV